MALLVAAIAVIVPLVSALSGTGKGATVAPVSQPGGATASTPASGAPLRAATGDSVVSAVSSTAVAAPPSDPVQATQPAATSPSLAEPVATIPEPVDSVRTTDPSATADPKCAPQGHSALVDRKKQRVWLCTDGTRGPAMRATTAWTMPDPGTYKVYAKDLKATSSFGGHFSRMTHFVAFSYGKRTGARVAFHSLPKLNSGQYVQPESSVGDLNRRGESNGCIRMLDDDVVKVWDHLAVGDPVVVLN